MTILHCMTHNDTMLQYYGLHGPCDPALSADNHLHKKSECTVFPNPSNSIFYISAGGGSEQLTAGQFRVYDSSGRLLDVVAEKEGNRMKINLQEFSDGMYWLQIEINGQFMGKRIMKI